MGWITKKHEETLVGGAQVRYLECRDHRCAHVKNYQIVPYA